MQRESSFRVEIRQYPSSSNQSNEGRPVRKELKEGTTGFTTNVQIVEEATEKIWRNAISENNQQSYSKVPVENSIILGKDCPPSTISISNVPTSDHNNNTMTEEGKEFWWDNSTDIGCLGSKTSSKTSSDDISILDDSAVSSVGDQEQTKNIQLEPNKTVVDKNTFIKEVSDFVIIESEVMDKKSEITVYENSSKYKQCDFSRLVPETLVSEEDLLSTNNLKLPPDSENKCFAVNNRHYQPKEQTTTLLPKTNRDELCDDDNAIVAVIRESLKTAEKQVGSGKVQDYIRRCRSGSKDFSSNVFDWHDSNCNNFKKDRKQTTLDPVKNSELNPIDEIANNQNFSLDCKSENFIEPEQATSARVCTPHSKLYVVNPFSTSFTNKTFSLPPEISNFKETMAETCSSAAIKQSVNLDFNMRTLPNREPQNDVFTPKLGSKNVQLKVDSQSKCSVIDNDPTDNQLKSNDGSNNQKTVENFQDSFIKLTTPTGFKPYNVGKSSLKKTVLSKNIEKFKHHKKFKKHHLIDSITFNQQTLKPSCSTILPSNKMTITVSGKNKVLEELASKNTCAAIKTGINFCDEQLDAPGLSSTASVGVNTVCHIFEKKNTCSNNLITAKTPPRRSPRTPRPLVISSNSSTGETGKLTTDTESTLAPIGSSQRIDIKPEKADTFSTLPTSCFQTSLNQIEQKSNTFVVSTVSNECQEPASKSFVIAPRKQVHSSIKSKVNDLMIQSSRKAFNPVYSPCLAALHTSGFNRKRSNAYLREAISYSFARSAVISNSFPSTPSIKRKSYVDSFQRSVSLSDVFYDNTFDGSSVLYNSIALDNSTSASEKQISFIQITHEENVADENQEPEKNGCLSRALPLVTSSKVEIEKCLLPSSREFIVMQSENPNEFDEKSQILDKSTFESEKQTSLIQITNEENVASENQKQKKNGCPAFALPLVTSSKVEIAKCPLTRSNKSIVTKLEKPNEFNEKRQRPEIVSRDAISTVGNEEIDHSIVSFAKTRTQKLEVEVENELRTSAKNLLDKVSSNKTKVVLDKNKLNNSLLSHSEISKEQSPSSTNEKNLSNSSCDSSHAGTSQLRDQLPLEDQQQAFETNYANNEEEEEDMTGSKMTIVLPPKKPTRLKSPSNRFKNFEKQTLKAVCPQIKQNVSSETANAKETETLPPILFYLPKLSLESTRNKASHCNSQGLTTENFTNHFLNGPGQAPWPFCTVVSSAETADCKMDLIPSDDRDHEEQKAGVARSTGLSLSAANRDVKREENVCASVSNLSRNGPFLECSDLVPFIFIPCQPPTKSEECVLRPVPTIQRRRSFAGVNSTVVERARLHRRRLQMQGRQPHLFNYARPCRLPLFNATQPTLRRPIRRPRFVKSSLSEDVVYEMTAGNNGRFLTKPIAKVTSNLMFLFTLA